jgi:hypothetical protein
MLDRATFEWTVQAAVIFSAAMLGATAGSLFVPEAAAILTAGVVALGVMALLAHQRHS